MPSNDKVEGNKRGRPPLPKGDVLEAITPVRLTANEKAVFEKQAKKEGLSLSVWIRKTLQKAV